MPENPHSVPRRRTSRDPAGWLAPGQCTRCRHVFDSGPVEVVARYADCTVFKCPGCGSSIDDRPIGWGGSFKTLTRAEAVDEITGRAHWTTKLAWAAGDD